GSVIFLVRADDSEPLKKVEVADCDVRTDWQVEQETRTLAVLGQKGDARPSRSARRVDRRLPPDHAYSATVRDTPVNAGEQFCAPGAKQPRDSKDFALM